MRTTFLPGPGLNIPLLGFGCMRLPIPELMDKVTAFAREVACNLPEARLCRLYVRSRQPYSLHHRRVLRLGSAICPSFFASELTGNFINDEIFLICKRLLPHGQGWPPGRIERSAYLSDLQ